MAEQGYAAVCPNLFHRITDSTMTGVEKAGSLLDPQVVADVNAAVGFLQSRPSVVGDRIGITGFCMGGRVSWLAAASIPAITASAPYYGGNIMVARGGDQTPFELADGINCPIMFHFGEIDANPSPEDMMTPGQRTYAPGQTPSVLRLPQRRPRLRRPHQPQVQP